MSDADDAGLVEVQRYDVYLGDGDFFMIGHPEGRYVAFADYEAQRREIEELRREVGHPMGHDCQLCEQPIYGSMRGFGDGTGQKFVCTECWFRHEAKEAEAALAEAVEVMEPFIDVLGEDSDGDIPDDTAVTVKYHRVTHYALKVGDFRAASAFAAKHGAPK